MMQYEYEIVDGRVHIVKSGKSRAAYVFWPEELIRSAEEQRTGKRDPVLPDFAEILAVVLEEHPELFTCHYNSDVIM
ncbi:hypothetical protein [Sulfurimonas sp. HSL3-7]|uniref:hypothetical protein n=1 Tax=Sulfonitrofixus jiaomeiensis TaxID=3131938 RepID=UPI0031F9C774